MKAKIVLAWFVSLCAFLLAGCNYDFPLTAQPTRPVDGRLLGDWVAVDKENAKEETMHVRQFDDVTYAVSMDNDIYRVFHSDFSGVDFLSVQDLNAGNRKYLCYIWRLSNDGALLSLQGVSEQVVPAAVKNRAALQELIKQNLGNPKLFGTEIQFARKVRKL